MMQAIRVYLSLGSNIGNRRANIARALELIEKKALGEIVKSPLYETPPVGPQDQDSFYNMVISFDTGASVMELLNYLKGVEVIIGRKKRSRWGAREIDCDILYYGTEIVQNSYITVPHKEIKNRLFVLIPFCDINSTVVDLREGKSVRQLLDELLTRESADGIKNVDEY